MAETNEKILETTETKLMSKPNEEFVQRTVIKVKEGEKYKMVSEINKKKIKREMLPQVIERMQWPKFGLVKGQPRGSLEPGIIVTSTEEIHIQDRQNEIDSDLGDKIKDTVSDRKRAIMNEFKEEKERREREARDRLSALTSDKNKKQKITTKKNKDGTIRVTGFSPAYNAEKLVEIFSVVGPINSCNMPSKHSAFIQFANTIHAREAFEMFDDKTVDNCVLTVQVLEN